MNTPRLAEGQLYTVLPGRNDERAISVEVYRGDRVRMRGKTFERHPSFDIPNSDRLVE